MRSLFFKYSIGALTSVLLPPPCRICGQILLNATRIPICDDCLGSFEKIAEPMCQCCGRPFASTVSADAKQPLCRLCRVNFFAFDRARSFAIYNDALFEAIMLMKYEEVTSLGTWFAARIAEVIRETAGEWQADAVMPVPLHRARQRERGHNQAELIARPLAKAIGAQIKSRCLVRIKPRPDRLLLSRSERWKAVRGAYATGPGQRVDNLRVLLIDDVMTTGATLDACARALKKAGASGYWGLLLPGSCRDGLFRRFELLRRPELDRN
jgi:ComF family protein